MAGTGRGAPDQPELRERRSVAPQTQLAQWRRL
jgi:hypothetical protein